MLRNAVKILERRAALKYLRTAQLFKHTSTTSRMSSHLSNVTPTVSHVSPADSYQLLATIEKSGSAEDALYEQEVKDVRDWWATQRYAGIKRTYSAEDVVTKRGALQQSYPSSLMARKLYNLFQERAAAGEPVHTSASRPL